MYANRTPGRPRSRTSSDPGHQPPVFAPYKQAWPAPARTTTDPASHPAFMMNAMPTGNSSRAPSRSSSVERNDPFVPPPGSLLAQIDPRGAGMASDFDSRSTSLASTPASARSPSPGGYFNRPPSRQSFSRGSNYGYTGPGGGGGSVSGASFKNGGGGGSIAGGPLIRDVPQPSRTAVNADVGPPARSFDAAHSVNQGRNFTQAPQSHPSSLQAGRRDAPSFPQAQFSMPLPHQQMQAGPPHPSNQPHQHMQPPSPASDVQHRENFGRHESFHSANSHQSLQAHPSQHQHQHQHHQQQQQQQLQQQQQPQHPFAGAQGQQQQQHSPNSAQATFQSRQRVHERPPSAASHRYASSLTQPVYKHSGQSSGTLGGSHTSLVAHGRSSSLGAGAAGAGPGMHGGGPGSPPPPPLPAHGSGHARGRPGPGVNGGYGPSGRSSSLPKTGQNGDYGLGTGYHEHPNPHYLEKPEPHAQTAHGASASGHKSSLSKTESLTTGTGTGTTKRRKNTSFGESDAEKAHGQETPGRRPPLPPTTSSGLTQTRYVNMLLALDDIPELFNVLASFFTWILLAGYVLFPGTFSTLSGQESLGSAETLVITAITDIPLYIIAWVCTGIGAVGMCYLWWRWMNNYIWLCNRIFLPGLLNSIAGIISTLTSVLGAQHGVFTSSSRSTIVVTGAVAAICAGLFGVYQFVLLRRIKREHQKTVGVERAGEHGEGAVRRRKVREKVRNREMP